MFFLDDYHVRLGNSLAARKHLVEFVQTQLGPKDLVSVMYPLSPLDSVVLTRDHGQLVNAIERFQGRKFDYTPRNALEDRYANYPTEIVERVRRQVSLSALAGLSVKLGALREGRKAIVLVSEGYVALLPPQMRGAVATMPGLGNPNRNNPMAGENNLNEDRARFAAELDVQTELQRVFDSANRSNTTIYAVDPRGLSTGEFDIQDNVMGRASQEAPASDPEHAAPAGRGNRRARDREPQRSGQGHAADRARLERVLPARLQLHPVAQRRQVPWDQGAGAPARGAGARPARVLGAHRPLKPRARSRRPSPDRRRRSASRSRPSPRCGDRRFIRTWVGTAPAASGKTKVTVVWEAIPPTPGSGRAAVGRVVLNALSPAGDSYFKGPVGGDGSETLAPGATRRGTVEIEVPPGKLSLRLAIEGKPDDVLDTDDRTIEVPDFTEPKARLSTPRVYVARNAREFQAIKADPAAAPTATREFRRTERLLLRLDAVAPGAAAGALTYSARLLNRQGDRMLDLPVAPPPPNEPATIEVPLASLPAGEFLVELAAKTSDGADSTELVAFRMVG